MAEPKVINPNDELVDLDGKPLKTDDGIPLSLGRAIALCLINERGSADPLRSVILSRKFVAEEAGELSFDKSDIDYLESCCKKSSGFSALVIGQILEKIS